MRIEWVGCIKFDESLKGSVRCPWSTSKLYKGRQEWRSNTTKGQTSCRK